MAKKPKKSGFWAKNGVFGGVHESAEFVSGWSGLFITQTVLAAQTESGLVLCPSAHMRGSGGGPGGGLGGVYKGILDVFTLGTPKNPKKTAKTPGMTHKPQKT